MKTYNSIIQHYKQIGLTYKDLPPKELYKLETDRRKLANSNNSCKCLCKNRCWWYWEYFGKHWCCDDKAVDILPFEIYLKLEEDMKELFFSTVD